ncbi:hypothetical protein [Eubacterium sp. MSJ-33]|uniref:hypothetical protein n=1 Tax=Eubacterium sp. MSJ-33 TaxID=2841528 RepID=UPI001C75CB7E|nr:hypothetical protein [Eubacterium sp. MSJ-33]QWT52208.1 hypothetical protein KP625_08910 [Eubacterium sp. MSJ-33]
MLIVLYKILDRIRGRRIKLIMYSFFGDFANIYMRVKYLIKYFIRNKKRETFDNDSNIIVSLTTFPARIEMVYLTICSLLDQTVKPKKLILWLADTQFQSIDTLPRRLLRLVNYGLEIRFCDDLRSHKKYYYTCKEYPEYTIITVDDDIFYPPNLIQKLVEKSKSYPTCVCCNRGHEITFCDKRVDKYNKWKKEATYLNIPSAELCPTGVGGILYPPGCFYYDFLNKDKIIECAIMADDLWLKVMELMQGTKAVYTDGFPQWLFTIRGTQKDTLSQTNVHRNNNDIVMEHLEKTYNINIYELCHCEKTIHML